MSEKGYLVTVIGIVEHGDKRLRVLSYKLAFFAIISIILLSLLAKYAGLNTYEYYLFAGIVMGVVVSKLSSIYNFRYVYKYIDLAGLKNRLERLNA